MAAGHDLKEGYYTDRPISDDEMWSVFTYLFSSKSVNDTSYKFGFLKSILDNLYNVDDQLTLTFDQLFSKFAEIYWNLVLKHHILQKNPGKLNRRSALESVLYDAKEKYQIEDEDAERIRMERDDELAIGSLGSVGGGSAYRRSSDSKYISQAEIDMEKWRRGVDERMRLARERGEMEDRIKALIPLVIILISFIISLFNGH